MRIKILLFFGIFFISFNVWSQEIGSVVNGIHSVKLFKSNNLYAFVFSDSYSKNLTQKSFNFPIKETVYNIMIDGFSSHSNHQIFVQVDEKTIVKFQYKIINNRLKVKIIHNNLLTQKIGASTFLSKNQVQNLFGLPKSLG